MNFYLVYSKIQITFVHQVKQNKIVMLYRVIMSNQLPIDVEAPSAKEARNLAAYRTKGYLTKTKQLKNIVRVTKIK